MGCSDECRLLFRCHRSVHSRAGCQSLEPKSLGCHGAELVHEDQRIQSTQICLQGLTHVFLDEEGCIQKTGIGDALVASTHDIDEVSEAIAHAQKVWNDIAILIVHQE